QVPAYAGAPGPEPAGGAAGARATSAPAPGHPGASYPGLPPDDHPPRGPLPPAGGERPRRHRTMTGIVAAAIVAGVVGGAGGFSGAYALLDGHSASSVLTTAPAATAATAPTVPGTVTAAAAAAMPSTVDIQVPQSQGSDEGAGIILTADGDVLTNNHVISGATGPITVTLSDGSQHTATVVGTSPSYDLAVLKIQGVSGLTPATLANSANLEVGQTVVAIGSPEGLTGTVTSGIVSALDRTVTVQTDNGTAVVYNGLQTDAPINPGNSGGPLVNLQGQVVGIDSAIASAGSQGSGQTGQAGSIGLGFAIPVDQAQRVAQELMATGTATKPVLGVQGNAAATTTAGAQIAAVTPGSPAAQAGLAAGDVITKVGNDTVQDFADLIARIGAAAPGSRVALTVTNGGATRTVQVTLGSTPDQAATTSNGGQSTSPFSGQGASPFGGGN
ncbi:trypsin-like peptidase domain-containing protein, partial [Pseudonocardia sp.]|uniref:S1C family serine protease n=1 Tax=Pseudonocardia sp. TaxID=60912 RepID=UPI002624A3B0